jgi:hypothetical protein
MMVILTKEIAPISTLASIQKLALFGSWGVVPDRIEKRQELCRGGHILGNGP